MKIRFSSPVHPDGQGALHGDRVEGGEHVVPVDETGKVQSVQLLLVE